MGEGRNDEVYRSSAISWLLMNSISAILIANYILTYYKVFDSWLNIFAHFTNIVAERYRHCTVHTLYIYICQLINSFQIHIRSINLENMNFYTNL